jgi:hypothetical protein
LLVLGPLAVLAGASRAAGDEPRKAETENRVAVGTIVPETGKLLSRANGEKTWHLAADNEAIQSGDLILGTPGAAIDSKNGAVRMVLRADLAGLSQYPIRECAVRLHENPNADLDFTLDRGRAEVINHKEKGSARVVLRIRKESWDFTLLEPGTRLAMELYGRWPRGVPFNKDAKPDDPKQAPTASLAIIVLHGQVNVKYGGREHAMSAPPGPALLEWDSVTDQDEVPQSLKELPAWAAEGADNTPQAQQRKAALQRLRQALETKPLDAVLDDLINSDNVMDRRLALTVMAALDDIPRLGKALREAKHSDVWENGILALRHWIGRAPGQDQILYHALIQERKLKPVHAETVLQLLHSFGDTELAQAETYQTLIDYLDHELLPIRGLAYWHLERLAPAGKEFGYNPLDSKEARAAAIEKWRMLIPPGKLPPRRKANGE